MKHPRPIVPLLAAALVAATLAGCGGGDDDGGEVDARFTSQDVQKRFQELTGFRLESSRAGLGSTSLSLATDGPDSTLVRQRFGTFRITVSDDDDALERQEETIGSGPSARIENLLVRGYGSDEDAGFRRVVAVLRTLGRPLSSVRLAPEDTPCESLGIDPDGGDSKTGTCLEGAQTVTVVPADGTLTLPTETVSKPVTRIARSVTSRRYGTARTLRARGQFVTVAARIENTSNAPLNQPQADLIINGRRYAPDTQDYLLQDRLEYQPGERATVTFLFDIPRTAEDPRTGGALQFSKTADAVGSSERAVAVGRLRLR